MRDPVGIISERDILERVILRDLDPKTTPIANAMTAPIVLLPVDCTPGEALEFMRAHRLHQVPIVSAEALVGIVSSTDLLQWATSVKDLHIESLTDYCSGRYPG